MKIVFYANYGNSTAQFDSSLNDFVYPSNYLLTITLDLAKKKPHKIPLTQTITITEFLLTTKQQEEDEVANQYTAKKEKEFDNSRNHPSIYLIFAQFPFYAFLWIMPTSKCYCSLSSSLSFSLSYTLSRSVMITLHLAYKANLMSFSGKEPLKESSFTFFCV